MTEVKKNLAPENQKDRKEGFVKVNMMKADKIPQFRFDFLGIERIEEASHFYTKSFTALNPMWKKMGATYNQVYSINRGRMISCVKAGWVCIMLNSDDELVAVAPSMDLIDYMKVKSMPHNSPFFKTLMKYAHENEHQYFEEILKTAKRGENLYNYGGAINLKYANYGISRKFWAQGLIYLKYAGWKTYFGRATNRISTKLLCGFGAKIVKTTYMKEPGMEGEFMELLRLDLKDLNFDTLNKYLQEKDPSLEEFDGQNIEQK